MLRFLLSSSLGFRLFIVAWVDKSKFIIQYLQPNGMLYFVFHHVYMGIQGLVLLIAFLLVSKCDHQQSGCYILWIGIFI